MASHKGMLLTAVLALCLGGAYLAWAAGPAPGSAGQQPPAAKAAGPLVTLEGRVVSNQGPVAGARVRVPGQEAFTLSDRQGFYRLDTPMPPQAPRVVTAGKPGWFNNGARLGWGGQPGEIRLFPVYLADQPGYRYYSPQVCFQCHGKVTRIWYQSKMAHTTANPKLLDMYYGTSAERAAGKGPAFKLEVKGSQGDCAVCHAPSAASNPLRSRDLENVLTSPLTEWEGVSCDYCHKVRKVVPSKASPSGYAALQERQYPLSGRSIMVFGPYDDVVTPPMAASYAPVFRQGEFCATCHSHLVPAAGGKAWDPGKVYSPAEVKGLGLGNHKLLPVQTTYQEWKAWQDSLPPGDPDKGKRCQFCHMSWQKKLLPYENYVVDGMARRMFGGTYRSPRDIHPHHFEGGTHTQLQSAVALELAGKIQKNRLVLKVLVSNTNGGHWVPTGEPMRNLFLLVQAKGADGKPLELIDGPRLPSWAGRGGVKKGGYAGLPGAAFARVLADDSGHLNVPYWRATRVASDTRLRPKTTRTITFVYRLKDELDEPSAEARLVYRPVVRPLALAKDWRVQDITITDKAW